MTPGTFSTRNAPGAGHWVEVYAECGHKGSTCRCPSLTKQVRRKPGLCPGCEREGAVPKAKESKKAHLYEVRVYAGGGIRDSAAVGHVVARSAGEALDIHAPDPAEGVTVAVKFLHEVDVAGWERAKHRDPGRGA